MEVAEQSIKQKSQKINCVAMSPQRYEQVPPSMKGPPLVLRSQVPCDEGCGTEAQDQCEHHHHQKLRGKPKATPGGRSRQTVTRLERVTRASESNLHGVGRCHARKPRGRIEVSRRTPRHHGSRTERKHPVGAAGQAEQMSDGKYIPKSGLRASGRRGSSGQRRVKRRSSAITCRGGAHRIT